MNTTTLPSTNSAAEPRLDFAKAAPAVFAAMRAAQQTVNQSEIERPLMEFVKIRASQINGCAFCLDMHFRDAKKAGETDERLYLLNAWQDAPHYYTERERSALRWTEALTRLSSTHISEELFNEVRAHFSEAELTQLTLAIVVINGWNRFNVGFNIPPRFAF